eukprot:5034516-Pyramimonas_sp.AAC.1
MMRRRTNRRRRRRRRRKKKQQRMTQRAPPGGREPLGAQERPASHDGCRHAPPAGGRAHARVAVASGAGL